MTNIEVIKTMAAYDRRHLPKQPSAKYAIEQWTKNCKDKRRDSCDFEIEEGLFPSDVIRAIRTLGSVEAEQQYATAWRELTLKESQP